MSYSNVASALTSVVGSIITAITGFLNGIATFISQNADIFVAIAIAGILVGLITKFSSTLPFVGSFLNMIGL